MKENQSNYILGNLSLGSLFIISFALLYGLTGFKQEDKSEPSLAKVNRYENKYVFTDCQPAGKYKYLGTVEADPARFNDRYKIQYTDVRKKLLAKAAEKYPDCNGVIITCVSGQNDKADCIILAE